MKKVVLALALFCILGAAQANAEIKGDTLRINGIKVLKVYGNHYERGYAYGHFLAKEIYDVYFHYFIQNAMGNLLPYYSQLKDNVQLNAQIDPKYVDEAQGIVDGINSTDFNSTFYDIWERDFDKYDLLLANTIVEIASNFGCAALMSWGDATLSDPVLKGEMIVTRHLDWSKSPYLYKNQLILAVDPDEADEQRWISFGFPGLIGVLSGVNNSGLAAFQHMGVINDYVMGSAYEPIFFSLRRAIEQKDVNNDGLSRTDDIVDAIMSKTQGGSFIIDAVNSIENNDSAVVIECTGVNKAVRSIDEYSQISGTNLLATNHFRKLYPAEECDRYDAVQESLLLNNKMSLNRSWDVMADGAGVQNSMQTIQFVPAAKDIRIGFTDAISLGWEKEPFAFNFDDLFAPTSVIETASSSLNIKKISPNPAVNSIKVDFTLTNSSNVEIQIVSPSGRIEKSINLDYLLSGDYSQSIDISGLASGVYFIKVKTDKISVTNKIITLK